MSNDTKILEATWPEFDTMNADLAQRRGTLNWLKGVKEVVPLEEGEMTSLLRRLSQWPIPVKMAEIEGVKALDVTGSGALLFVLKDLWSRREAPL